MIFSDGEGTEKMRSLGGRSVKRRNAVMDWRT